MNEQCGSYPKDLFINERDSLPIFLLDFLFVLFEISLFGCSLLFISTNILIFSNLISYFVCVMCRNMYEHLIIIIEIGFFRSTSWQIYRTNAMHSRLCCVLANQLKSLVLLPDTHMCNRCDTQCAQHLQQLQNWKLKTSTLNA